VKVIEPSVQQLTPKIDDLEFLKSIELAARTCYKSENKITDTSAYGFVKQLLFYGHDAMLEHAPNISLKFICDRGVSHELVRHRLFSYAQESTRYCNYGGEVVYIVPCWFKKETKDLLLYLSNINKFTFQTYEGFPDIEMAERVWIDAMISAEESYRQMLNLHQAPQQGRSVLPNSLKTEIVVTGNVRQWRHFFKLRTAKNAHPQMREVARIALDILTKQLSVLFDEFEEAYL